MEYAKVTLLIALSDVDSPRPDKWNWTSLADHNSTIHVVDAEFMSEQDAQLDYPDEVPTDG